MPNIQKLVNEKFIELWDGEPWKQEEHEETFQLGFSEGIQYALDRLNPILDELKENLAAIAAEKLEEEGEADESRR